MIPEGFYNFTDVQVASSMIFSIMFLGFGCGVLVSDGFSLLIKFLIKLFHRSRA